MQLMKFLCATLAFFLYAAVGAPVPQNNWIINAIHPPLARVRPPTRTNNVEMQDLSHMNLPKPPYSRPAENSEDIYHAAPFHYAPGWEPTSKMPATDFRPTRKFGPKPNTYSDFMESNMKAAAQGLAGNKEDFYGASSSSKSPVGGISQETKDALFGNSPWFSFRPPNANENEPLGKKISNSPKGAPKSKEEESQHLKDIGVNIQTESSGKVHQNEAVDKSSSSSPPTKDKAVQEGSSSANTPVKEQEDQASKESLSSSSAPAKAKEDQAVEEGSSSSNTHVKGQKDEVAEKSSSSSPPVTKQEGQADQENSSLGSTPIKEQEDSAAKQTRPSGESNDAEEDSRSSELYLDENDDEVEDSRSSAPSLDESNEEEDSRASKAYLEEIDDEEDNSRSPESSLDESNEDEDSRSSEAYSEEIDEEEEDSRSSEAYSEEAENQEDDFRSSEAYSEESNGDEDDSRSSEAYSEAISEEEDSSSSEPSLEDAPPTENVNPTDPVLSSANAPSTPGKSNFKPIKLLLKRAVKFVTDKKNGVTYKLAKVYLPDFPEAITSQPHFIGAKYRGNPIRRKYQFSRQNKDGSFLYWRPKKWNHRERHIVVYPFEEGVQARSIFQTRDEGFDVPAWSNSTDTSYPVVDDYEEDFRDDEDDIIEDIEYYPEDLASLYDTPNSKSSPNLETSNTNTITTPILPRSVANPASLKEGSDTISPIGQRDARSSGADQLFDIWDDENKIEIKGLHDKHALEYINAPIAKASLNPKPGYTSKAESKAGAEKEKLKEKEESSEKTDIFFSEKTGTFNSAPKRTIKIWGY